MLFDVTYCLQVFMGIFYYIKSVALAEDLPLKESYEKLDDFYRDADRGYNLVSLVLLILLLYKRVYGYTSTFNKIFKP